MSVNFLEKGYFRFEKRFKAIVSKLLMRYSRFGAIRYRKQVIRRKGKRVVDRRMKKKIKIYSKKVFGASSYWPYLALYSEIRGKFIEGWMPYDYYRYKLLPTMNPKDHRALSNVKTFDHRLFGDFAVRPLFMFISGMFFSPEMQRIDRGQLQNILFDFDGNIVVKEEFGMGGKQIKIMHSSEFIPDMLREQINYVVQPYIKQYHILSDLYPDSLNTLKVTTRLTPEGKVDITFVILRFGVDGSKIDNLSSGGCYIYFDSNGRPSSNSYDYKLGFDQGTKHKNTGYPFSKIRLPMFDNIMKKCKEAHTKYPYVHLIGWDVCVTESGDPKLIEWNAFSPSFWEYEAVFGPFWPEDKIEYGR